MIIFESYATDNTVQLGLCGRHRLGRVLQASFCCFENYFGVVDSEKIVKIQEILIEILKKNQDSKHNMSDIFLGRKTWDQKLKINSKSSSIVRRIAHKNDRLKLFGV